MNRKSIWSLIAVLLAVLVLAAGCEKTEPAQFAEITDIPAPEETVAPEATAVSEEAAVSEETVQATVEVPAPETLLCTINGKELTYGDIASYIQSISSMYVNEYGYDATDPELMAYCNQAGMYFAQQYVILDELGNELGVTFTEEEQATVREQALTAWNEIITYYEQAYYGISEESTEDEKNAARTGTLALLESIGYTEESYIESEVENSRYDKILSSVTKDIAVTDSELDEYINGLIAADRELYAGEDVSYYEMMNYYGYPTYYRPDGYRAVTHILLSVDEELMNSYNDLTARYEEQQSGEASEPVEETEATDTAAEAVPETTEEPVTAEQVEAARQAVLASVQPTVDEIMEKFNAGTPFADLIAEYGTDPGMQQEGALETGYEVAATSMLWDIPFRDAAMSIQNIGEVSEPVVGSYGVHIVYYLKDIPGGPVELTAEGREGIRNEILSERQNELLDSTVTERMNAASIVYTDEAAPFIPQTEEEVVDEAANEATETVIGGADGPTEIVLAENTTAE